VQHDTPVDLVVAVPQVRFDDNELGFVLEEETDPVRDDIKATRDADSNLLGLKVLGRSCCIGAVQLRRDGGG